MSQPEMTPPLANSCETCPVRQLIDVNKAQCIGASSIGTQEGVWERYSDGEKPPIKIIYANGDVDDSRVAWETRATGAASRGNCVGVEPVTPAGFCVGAGAEIQYALKGEPWWSAMGFFQAPEASPDNIGGVISQKWEEQVTESTWYVRSESAGWARDLNQPFANGDTFTVTRSLAGKLAFLEKGSKCFFGTDVDDDGTRLAKVKIDGYASVYFAYESAVHPDMPSEERSEILALERQQLQVQGLDMLLNGWDIEASTAALERIEEKYAVRREQMSEAVDWLMSDEGTQAFKDVFGPHEEDPAQA